MGLAIEIRADGLKWDNRKRRHGGSKKLLMHHTYAYFSEYCSFDEAKELSISRYDGKYRGMQLRFLLRRMRMAGLFDSMTCYTSHTDDEDEDRSACTDECGFKPYSSSHFERFARPKKLIFY